MRVTATEAKNRFGSVCSQAKVEPVFVEKDGEIDSVILSAKMYQQLSASQTEKTEAARKAEFQRKYRRWLERENSRFEKEGLWCDELRVW